MISAMYFQGEYHYYVSVHFNQKNVSNKTHKISSERNMFDFNLFFTVIYELRYVISKFI